MFLKVSAIRIDGGVQSTTFDGYAAETCALKYYNELKSSKYISFIQLSEQHTDKFSEDISWEIRMTQVLFPQVTSCAD